MRDHRDDSDDEDDDGLWDNDPDFHQGFVRVPGLFPRWELAHVVVHGQRYLIDDAGLCQDGTPLFFVYRLAPEATATAP
jgi:hypothetical protein